MQSLIVICTQSLTDNNYKYKWTQIILIDNSLISLHLVQYLCSPTHSHWIVDIVQWLWVYDALPRWCLLFQFSTWHSIIGNTSSADGASTLKLIHVWIFHIEIIQRKPKAILRSLHLLITIKFKCKLTCKKYQIICRRATIGQAS